jgi:hypothetical protein
MGAFGEVTIRGVCMPSSKYHRDQAQVLAGLALSTNDQTDANRLMLSAMEHLDKAEAAEATAMCPAPPAKTQRRQST